MNSVVKSKGEILPGAREQAGSLDVASAAGTGKPGTSAASGRAGAPLELDMALIDEDPRQPRSSDNPGFSAASLNEMAASIRLRGVKTPISVRDNPDAPGRSLINHGARRFRGSKLAGKTTIPGYVDNDYNEADQVVENLQRNALTAREIADYIGRELAKGVKKGDIARSISKSPAFVTQHIALLDLPDPIAAAFNLERVRDVTLVNELVTAFKKHPGEVGAWLGDEQQEITRGSVKLLRDFLDNKTRHVQSNSEVPYHPDGLPFLPVAPTAKRGAISHGPDRLRHVTLVVRHNKRAARLILDRRPHTEGCIWLRYEDDGQECEAGLAHIRLVALEEE